MINRKVISLGCIVLSFICFIMYFIFRDINSESSKITYQEKEEMIGDIIFSYIDKSVYIKDMIPTLDKFGIMNDAFTFTIKNNSQEPKKYTLSLIDEQSTIKNSDIRYELSKNDIVIGIDTLSNDGIIDVGELNSKQEVKYSLKLWLNYNSEYLVGTFRKKIGVTEGEKGQISVNKPVLVNGMIPVYYDIDNNSWYKSDIEDSFINTWYDYSEQKWANAITVKQNRRDFYEKSGVGTKIMPEDINSFWVWIPRFNYELENNTIKIHFVKESEVAYPAFSFANFEIPGFWINKFESGLDEENNCIKTSLTKDCNKSDIKLYFAPNYPFSTRITMANLFYAIRKMEFNENIYGFQGAGSKLNYDGTINNDGNNLDIHMMKNSEWQAVALLSDSIYGKRGNKNYQGDEQMIYQNNSNYTGKSFYQEKLYDYNITLVGEGASTTGNITGVYDMAGGKREYVMIDNEQIDLFNGKSNSGFTTKVKSYYYDNDFLSDTTLQFKDRYSNHNSITSEPITRGGYKNTGNIFNVYSVNDYINKISLETNSRACLVSIKEKENDKE